MRLEFPATPQTARLSLSIFCLTQLAVSEVEEGQSQNQQQHYHLSLEILAAIDPECFAFTACADANCGAEKWEKAAQMFEPKASFCVAPFFSDAIGNPKGSCACVAFFGLPFLAKQKRQLAVGPPPTCER